MNRWSLLWMGLRRKRARTLLTLVSVATAFTLFGLLHGTSAIFDSVVQGAQLNRLYVMSRAGFGRSLPLSYVAKIENTPGVSAVAPIDMVIGHYADPKNSIVAYGVDPERFVAVFPETEVRREHVQEMTHTRTGVLVGARLAERFGWQRGDRIPLITREGTLSLDVLGTFETPQDPSQANALLIDYDYVDALRAGRAQQSHATMIVARIAQPSLAARIAGLIDDSFSSAPEETRTQNEKEWAQSQVQQIGNVAFMMHAILGAVFFALLLLTGTSMLQSMRERIPELAVLKTLGFTDTAVAGLVLSEALVLCVSAAVLGLTFAWLLFPMLQSFAIGISQLPVVVWYRGLAIAVLLALVSASAPTWSTARLSIVAALAK